MDTKHKKSVLLAGFLASSLALQNEKYFNPYSGVDELSYSGTTHKSYSKSPLTNKQKKSRAASKRAKKARKRNR